MNKRTKLLAAVAIAVGAATSAHADPVIADCTEVVPPYLGTKLARRTVLSLQSSKVQKLAKKIADGLEQESLTDSDITNSTSGSIRLSEKFKTSLLAQILKIRLSGSSDEQQLAENWIVGMSPRALLSCFPSFAVALRAFLPRVEAARQAAKQRQEEEVVRAKLPINVLATAYAAYIDVKRCYEAREGYLARYITDIEMEQARNAVQQIEEALKPKLDQNAKADDVWSRVEQTEGRKFSLGRDYQAGARMICQDQLGLLLQTLHEQVPESGKVKKDF
jgi:hypothetical protein